MGWGARKSKLLAREVTWVSASGLKERLSESTVRYITRIRAGAAMMDAQAGAPGDGLVEQVAGNAKEDG